MFLEKKVQLNPRCKINNNDNKTLHIELLRIIAIYFVIFNHTGDKGFFLFANELESPFFPFYLFASVVCKIAVPIFYMITGALLLGKNESVKNVLFKRVLRYVFILFVVSFLYWILGASLPISVATLRVFWVKLISDKMTTQLWYLYSYIGVLIMLPLLRRFVISMREKDYMYLLICHVIFVGVVPVLRYILGNEYLRSNANFSIPIISVSCVFFVLMGYYVEHVLDFSGINKKKIGLLWILSILCIVISGIMTMYKADVTGVLNEENSQSFHSCLIAIPTLTVYITCKFGLLKKQIPQIFQKIIRTVGATTFGIFLMEKILRFYLGYICYETEVYIGKFMACNLWVLTCVFIGFCFTYILKKIPLIRKFL